MSWSCNLVDVLFFCTVDVVGPVVVRLDAVSVVAGTMVVGMSLRVVVFSSCTCPYRYLPWFNVLSRAGWVGVFYRASGGVRANKALFTPCG